MDADSIPRSILLIVMILVGGLFAGTETAYSYSNGVRLRMLAETGSRKAKRAVRILDNFDRAIVTLLIVINIIYISASSVATVLSVKVTGSNTVGPIAATVITTLAIFIFSETIPKNIARANSDSYAMAVSLPLEFFMLILYPLSTLLTLLGTGIKKLFRLEDTAPSVTEDEFATMVEDAEDDGLIEPEETEIIKSAIEFGDTRVEEIMTPRKDIVSIPLRADEEDIKKILIEEKYSRFPVYRGGINNIVGIVRTTDALWKIINSGDTFVLRENLSKPLFVEPDEEISQVFEKMCNKKNHFAVVREDSEKTVGIITMEDILEEIFGEIYDEDDKEEAGDTHAS